MSDNVTYDAGDEAQVSKKKTKAQLRREKELEELRQVLSSRAGRSVIWRILGWCGVYDSSFTGNSTTFFNEGKRKIGQLLIEELAAADKRVYAKMQLEAVDNTEEHDA